MPRGKYVNHKGRSRHFTSPEELQQESEEESDQSSSGSEKEEQSGTATGAAGAAGTSKQPSAARKPAKPAQRQKQQRQQQRRSSSDEESGDDDDSDDDSEADARDAKKGVASLIEIENPNRVTKKATQKLSQIKIDDATGGSGGGGGGSSSGKPELSRREREQIEKQKARQRYEKLHAAGKTTEAKADLARLALIRQQREEAAAKREAEKKSVADLSKKPVSK